MAIFNHVNTLGIMSQILIISISTNRPDTQASKAWGPSVVGGV